MIVNSNSPSEWMKSGPGAERRILCESRDIMMVAFRFKAGGEGYLHSHPHVQTTYIESGRFRFTLGGETRELAPGDSVVIPSNAEHGCVCLEDGVMIDAFTPRRDDFLEAHGKAGT